MQENIKQTRTVSRFREVLPQVLHYKVYFSHKYLELIDSRTVIRRVAHEFCER
jgi:hypothetical protein